MEPQDQSIMATADNALLAKQATVEAGYYEDPFLQEFLKSTPSSSSSSSTSSNSVPLGVIRDGDNTDIETMRSHGQIPRPRPQSRSAGRQHQHQHQHQHHIHQHPGRQQRRQVQPIIKRGTHARVACMDRAIRAFVTSASGGGGDDDAPECQIVVLGCGKDTSFFRYHAGYIISNVDDDDDDANEGDKKNDHPKNKMVPHWYEVDHSSVIGEKYKIISNSQSLSSYCPNLVEKKKQTEKDDNKSNCYYQHYNCQTSNYHLIEHDLRDDPNVLMTDKLQLNPLIPTLFLIECVFMYLPDDSSRRLIQAIAQASSSSSTSSSASSNCWMVAAYEPIVLHPGDPFGTMMVQNLTKVGVATNDSCLIRTRTLESQLNKWIHPEKGSNCSSDNSKEEGQSSSLSATTTTSTTTSTTKNFVRAVGCDMWSAYQSILSNEERKHANQCEFLDEMEEWILIMKHYCFVIATTTTTTTTPTMTSTTSTTTSTSTTAAATSSTTTKNDFDDDNQNTTRKMKNIKNQNLTDIGIHSPMGFVSNKCLVLVRRK